MQSTIRQRAVWFILIAGCLAPVHAKQVELLVDPMTGTDHWQLGGSRVNYHFGDSSLLASREQVREGADSALKLTCDFRDERRWYLSAYWTGLPIPGRCSSFSFSMYGDASQRPLVVWIEDAAERWYQKRLGTVDWDGWREVTVEVAGGEDWQPLLRFGETRVPLEHPVRLRQIAVMKRQEAPPQSAVYFHELRAVTDAEPADFVVADIATGRDANLFYAPEPATFKVTFVNRGTQTAEGRVAIETEDFLGRRRPGDVQPIELKAGETAQLDLDFPTDQLGAYTAHVTLTTDARTRTWLKQFAVSRPGRELPFDHDAMFGCMFSVMSLRPEQLDTVFRLNRDAGVRWERYAFAWDGLEPRPGEFAWMPPRTVDDGASGHALAGTSGRFGTPPAKRLGLRDALTFSFRLKGDGANGYWQWVFVRADDTGARSYGAYVAKDTGEVYYTGGFEKFPDRQFMGFPFGMSAWDNKWHHYAATYTAKSGVLKLFVDGALSQEHAVNGGRIREQQAGIRFAERLNGALDDVALFDQELSDDAIALLAKGQTPGQAGLVARWTFDEPADPGHDSGTHGLHARREQNRYEQLARLAREHGMKVLGILGFPPQWASTAPPDDDRFRQYMPKLEPWANYVEAVTRHYRGLVDHWEIWNEPNIRVFWEPEPNPEDYAELVQVAYAAAKRGNPDCTVIAPGLAGPNSWHTPDIFLGRIIELGVARNIDALSIHPYRHREEPEVSLVEHLEYIADHSEKHGARQQLWITEWCWATQLLSGCSERTSAILLARGLSLALGSGLMDRIILFRMHDPGVDRFYLEHNCSLCADDLTPKPSYFAFRTCTELLEGAEPVPAPDLGQGVYCRRFVREGEHILALWSTCGVRKVAMATGGAQARVVDIMGNERTEKTRDGVLFLDASDTIQFVRGLDRRFERASVPAALRIPDRVLIGAETTVTLDLTNPSDREQPVQIALQFAESWETGSVKRTVTLPPRGRMQVDIRSTAPADGRPGLVPLVARVSWGGLSWSQDAQLPLTSVRPDSGPVAYWRFDEGEGTVASDSSGNANHGTVQACKWVPGRKGTALEFRGGSVTAAAGGEDAGTPAVEEVVTVPDSASLDLPEEVTVACWLKLTGDTGTWQVPVCKFLSNQTRNYGIYTRPDTFAACFSASFENSHAPHTDLASGTNLNDGKWHHVAATFSFSKREIAMFIDGEPDGSRTVDAELVRTNDEPVRIGLGTKAVIDEVIIYGRALTRQQIVALARG